jgi:hypothetical protein
VPAPAALADAKKEHFDRAAALALARQAGRVVVAKGKKVVVFDIEKAPPDDDTLAAHLLGPTGNLKAPALRSGTTLYVGFSDEAYRQLLD